MPFGYLLSPIPQNDLLAMLMKCITPPPPPFLHSNRPCIVSGRARELSFSVLLLYSKGRILRFSFLFAGWTRWCHWHIAVYFTFLASKALHCTKCHSKHFSFSQF